MTSRRKNSTLEYRIYQLVVYRKDIDGLRAISVLAVVLYHADGLLPGGFAGVDVFFVISGYLITGLICNDLEKGDFSLMHFWERRVRRIFPAALVCVSITVITGAVVMLPRHFDALASSSIAQCFAVSNFYFWRDAGGYFAGASETKPLLHTWSLGVEEQFYVLFPTFLIFINRFSRRQMIYALGWITLVSFLLSSWGTFVKPAAAFYLLPFRAWELLFGSLIAVANPVERISKTSREMLFVFGISMIFSTFFFYTVSTPFPGVYALLPVVGASLVIMANAGKQNIKLAAIIENRVLVFFGLISYSLYLWHWPVFAFLRYMLFEFDFVTTIVACLFSLILATASWRFVERGFRAKKNVSRKRVSVLSFLIAGFCTTVLFVSSSLCVWTDGLPIRFGQTMSEVVEDASWTGKESMATKSQIQHGDYLGIGELESNNEIFVVWGDSHALMLSDVLNDCAKIQGIKGRFVALPGVAPLGNVFRKRHSRAKPEVKLVLDYLSRSRPPNLLLIGRWSAYINGYTEGDLKFGEKDKKFDDFLIKDKLTKVVSQSDAKRVFATNLVELIKNMKSIGTKVWIMEQVPEHLGPIGYARYIEKRLGVVSDQYGVSIEEHRRRQLTAEFCLDKAANAGARIIRISHLFFDDMGHPIVVKQGRSIYRDNNHLSKFGANNVLRGLFLEVMERFSFAQEQKGND